LAKFFICRFADRSAEVHKHPHKKKSKANIQPSGPNKLSLVNSKFIIWDT